MKNLEEGSLWIWNLNYSKGNPHHDHIFFRTRPLKEKANQNALYDRYKSIIYEKGEMPKYVYFLLKGEVFFTNESGTFHYFKLSNGSYFGDVNILLNYKSSYSA